MSKKTPPTLAGDRDPGRGTELLQALSVAAAALQHSARSEDEVFRVFHQQVVGLGLRGGIGLLDATGRHVIVRAIAEAEPARKALAQLEELSGLKAEGYVIPLAEVEAYRQVVETGEAAFAADTSAVVAQLIPKVARPMTKSILKVFGGAPGVFSPLITEGKVQGVLSMIGAGLKADDVPAIAAFADHVAVALDTAHLFSALRESEQIRRLVLDNVDEIVYMVEMGAADSLSGQVVYVSSRVTTLLGYQPEDFVRDRGLWLSLIHPDDVPLVVAQTEAIFASGHGGTREYRVRHKTSGHYRWVEDRVVPQLAGAGQAIGVFGVARDVTDRKKADRSRNAQYTIAQVLAEASTLADATPKVLQAVCEVAQWERGELWAALWSVDEQTRVLRCVETWHPPGISFPDLELVTRETAFPPGIGLPGRVLATGEPAWVADLALDGNFPRAPAAAKEGLRCGAAFPIRLGSETLGVMAFLGRDVREPEDDLIQALGAIGSQIGQFAARHQAEAALLESGERYRGLVDNARDVIFAVSLDGLITSLNPVFEALTGWSRTEWVGQPFIPLLHPDDLLLAGEVFQRALLGESQPVVERRARTKSGDYVTWEISLTAQIQHGETVGVAGIARDVTERVRAEAALRASESRFRSLLEAAPDATLIVNTGGEIAFFNAAAEKLFGYTPNEVLGQTVEMLIPGPFQDLHRQQRRAYVAAPVSRPMGSGLELFARRKEGSQVPVDVMLGPVELEGELAVLTIVRDLTEPKRAEQALKLFRTLIDRSTDAIEVIDPETGRFLDINEKGCLDLGYSREEILALSILDIDPTVDESSFKGAVDELRKSGVLMREGFHRRKDGSTFPVEVNIKHVVLDRAYLVTVVRDITERKQRERERDAIVAMGAALRTAQTRAEMLPVLLDQLLDLLKAEGAAVAMRDPGSGDTIFELARGEWESWTGLRLPPGIGICGHVIATGQPYLNNDAPADPLAAQHELFGELRSVADVPLIAREHTFGALRVGRRNDMTKDDLNLLMAIGDMTANAVHRAALHEQTEQRLQQLTALRAIDMAISSSFDLRVTLGVLLDQALAQLHVDAADILVLQTSTQSLSYAAGRGFRTSALQHTQLQLGQGYAGRAALERHVVQAGDLHERHTDFLRSPGFAAEGFVNYIGAPLVARGEIKGVLELFHRSALTPDVEWMEFLEALAGQAAIAIDNASLFEGLRRSTTDLVSAYDMTIVGWSRALDLRDKETEGHTQRVTEMTLSLAPAMGVGEAELAHIRRGALLHDIGKMGVPDSILLKPGSLSEEEWAIMRRHPQLAYEMLSPIPYLRPALDIPYAHHEKWDGTGYPRGLAGDQIPLAARIFAVVDVWDALTSDRPYRAAWPQTKALVHIRRESGKHFDPRVVEAFLAMIGEP